MALTKATLIDLNANELILDLDADTSITADTDDTIHIKIGGSDEITITGTALSPSTSDGNSLGTSALEWSDLFLADGAVINFGDDQDVSLTHVADTGLLLSSTDQLQFGDSGTYIHQSADGVLDLVSDTEIEINATTIDVNGNLDVSGTIVGAGALTAATSITVGSAVLTEAELETLDGVTVGTAIASKVVTTDANIDTTGQRNLTISGELDAATGDFSGDVDIDGTANFDTVDIDGATQIDATVTVGVDDTGYDVKFFGATSGAHLLWDESVDDLILAGAARVVVPEGNLVLGSTAVTSTAAELNLLDGVSGLVQADLTKLAAVDSTAAELNLLNGVSGLVQADLTKLAAVDSTAAELNLLNGVSGLVQADLTKLAAVDSTATELNIVDGNTTVGTTAFADGDGIVTNDNGTMRQTSATTLKTYMADLTLTTAAQTNITSLGTLTALTVDTIGINAATVTASGDLIFDVASDIVLDADGGKIKLKDAGTEFGQIFNNSGLHIISKVSDQDIVFKGNDGGSEITAMTLDMSDAGTATFNHDIILGDSSVIKLGAGADLKLSHDGSNSYIEDAGTGNLRILASETVLMNAAGNEDMLKATADGAVELYYNNAKKFETTNIGVTINGTAIALTSTDTSNSGNVTLNFADNQNFVLTMTGNVTLVNPTTEQVGQSGFITLIQDGTGSRTLAVGNQYFGVDGEVPEISTAANAIDVIPYIVIADGKILLGSAQKAFSDAS